MKTIEEYIELSKNMPNTSDGGSTAYHFDDVVLIKYVCSLKYGGNPRKHEEEIAIKANEKRVKGVRTPAHLGIKRVIEGDNEICWVLQERAKGHIFNKYCYNKDSSVQLYMQGIIAGIPSSHYEKLIADVCELFNFGLELKSKNLFYDDDLQEGGFTIIDLLKYSGEPFNNNSLQDILTVLMMLGTIYNATGLNYGEKNEAYIKRAEDQHCKIIQNIYMAMAKVIPNFERHSRWVLRSFSKEELAFFQNNGINVGDLSLNEEEYEQFNQTLNEIVRDCIKKVETGKSAYWQIEGNEIRISLEQSGMQDAWLYHQDNKRQITDFEGEFADYDYKRESAKDLELIVIQMFNEQLALLAENSENPFLIKAKQDLDEKSRQDQGTTIMQ